MSKAKEYLKEFDADWGLTEMNHKTLEDVKELIEKRLEDPPEYLTGDEIHQLFWVLTELEKLKL